MKKNSEVKKWRAMSMVAAAVILVATAAAEPQVPCLFIFGDSLIDNGNNNNKVTIAKANFPPYGIDFPAGATGRFSNGKNIADVIGEFLGFENYIPSYASARGDEILKGVNYASAAAGIRPETGYQWGDRTYFGGQLDNFNNTIAQLVKLLGHQQRVTNHLGECIYMSFLGNNDFLLNYFEPTFYTTSLRYSLPQYISLLIQQYSEQLKVLYNYGARKIALVGTAPGGCIPVSLERHSPDGSTCVERFNRASQMFNQKLIALVDELNNNFRAAQFIYSNGYDPVLDLINNGSAHGFKVRNKACCGLGRNGAVIVCTPNIKPCNNRNEYLFWDFAHPTEAAQKVFGKRAYKAQEPSDAYPFDISHLAQLRL